MHAGQNVQQRQMKDEKKKDYYTFFLFDFSHASAVALGMTMPVSWSTTLVWTEISQLLLPMKFCTHVDCPRRMKPTDFSF